MRLEFLSKGSLTKEHGSEQEKAGLKVLPEESLCELQEILRMMMDDVIAVCGKYHLQYALIGGSAIGALRSGGIIPWDDDIDLAMPRADFEKFARIVRRHYGDRYTVLHPRDRDNEGRLIPKLRLKGTEYRTFLEWDLKESGICIDIFLLENIPDNPVLRKMHGTICSAFGFALSCRRLFRGRKHYRKLDRSRIFPLKCALGALLSFASIEQWTRWTDFWYSACRNRRSRDVSCPTDSYHYFGEIYPRSMTEDLVEVPFDGRKALVFREADPYLRGRYGDYMQVPEEAEQSRSWYLAYDPGIYGKKERADV